MLLLRKQYPTSSGVPKFWTLFETMSNSDLLSVKSDIDTFEVGNRDLSSVIRAKAASNISQKAISSSARTEQMTLLAFYYLK